MHVPEVSFENYKRPHWVALAQEITRLEASEPALSFEIAWVNVVALVGCLQLALRHPANRGAPARVARHLIDGVIERVEPICPDLARLLRLGDDPAHDQPAGVEGPVGGCGGERRN